MQCGLPSYCLFSRADVGQLALFHLTIEHNIKYYDLDEQVMPWIEDNLEDLQIGKFASLSKKDRKQQLHTALDAPENEQKYIFCRISIHY